jgi:hypothetical protein
VKKSPSYNTMASARTGREASVEAATMDRPASAAATLGGVGVGASSLALQGGEPICGWGAVA